MRVYPPCILRRSYANVYSGPENRRFLSRSVSLLPLFCFVFILIWRSRSFGKNRPRRFCSTAAAKKAKPKSLCLPVSKAKGCTRAGICPCRKTHVSAAGARKNLAALLCRGHCGKYCAAALLFYFCAGANISLSAGLSFGGLFPQNFLRCAFTTQTNKRTEKQICAGPLCAFIFALNPLHKRSVYVSGEK